jgi:hypothetical protein
MLLKFLFWGALLSVAMGINSPDGSLHFFFAAHLTMVATGLFLRKRDKRSRTGSAEEVRAGGLTGSSPKTPAS